VYTIGYESSMESPSAQQFPVREKRREKTREVARVFALE
jgi:hypothetical protein